MPSVGCSVCDESGILEEPYDKARYKSYTDPISGYTNWEVLDTETGKLVLASTLKPIKVTCFNCEGTGRLEWTNA